MIDDKDEFTNIREIDKQIMEDCKRELNTNLGVVIFTNKNLLGLYLSCFKKKGEVDLHIEKVKKFYENHKTNIDLARECFTLAEWETKPGWINFHVEAALKTNNFNMNGNR